MSEILNCPICGAKATKVINPKGDERWVMFKCSTLGCIQQQGFYRDEKEAIEQWNTRKPMQEQSQKFANDFMNEEKLQEIVYRLKKKINPLHNANWNSAIEEAIEICKEVGGMNDKKLFELDVCGEMLYRSPIQIIEHKIAQQMQMQLENEVLKIVHSHNIQVDKEELIKALNYDRGQYEKGFRDGSKVNKWIPCSERLPEEEKGVVSSVYNVTIQDKEKLCKPYSDVKRFNFESKTWQNIYDDEGVIAWQTLPEPYKEGET